MAMTVSKTVSRMKIINQETGKVIMDIKDPQVTITDEDGIHLYNQSAVDLSGNEFTNIMVDEFRPKEKI